MSKFEFVSDDDQDDQLVSDLSQREKELSEMETGLERWQHMHDHAEDYVPEGTPQEKALAAASLKAHAAEQLAKGNFQYAKAKAFHGAMKVQAASRGMQRMQAAKTRHTEKMAAERAKK